jgi:1,4-dihydroxy-2-naphthoyl-CoA hydrolase
MDRPEVDAAHLNGIIPGTFPEHVGMRIVEAVPGRVIAELEVAPHHRAPNGYLHAAAVVTLADTACGFGVRTVLPEGAIGFTTVELKANFLGTTLEGTITATATVTHRGRTTQVWDAEVAAGDRPLALFRCTQMILYPR